MFDHSTRINFITVVNGGNITKRRETIKIFQKEREMRRKGNLTNVEINFDMLYCGG